MLKQRLRQILGVIPGALWLAKWVDPLHTARYTLRQTMKRCAPMAHGVMLDIGCGYRPYAALFAHVDHYIGIDLEGDIDVCATALELPFARQVFDSVLCNQVLEHVPEPQRLLNEAMRVLKPGGVLILTTPQTWGLHHEPYDFFRYTKYGLKHLAETAGFEVTEVSPTTGLWATWAQRLADTVAHMYLRHSPRALVVIAGIVLAPIQLVCYMLDRLFGKQGDTLDNLLIARRPSA